MSEEIKRAPQELDSRKTRRGRTIHGFPLLLCLPTPIKGREGISHRWIRTSAH